MPAPEEIARAVRSALAEIAEFVENPPFAELVSDTFDNPEGDPDVDYDALERLSLAQS